MQSGSRRCAASGAPSFRNGRERFRPASGPGFSLTMTGDCCPWGGAIRAIRAGRAGDMVAAARPFIGSSDVRLMQWETPLTRADSPIVKSGPNLRCPPETVGLMTALGIDTALLANNHIGDYGGAAVLETRRHLKAAGIRSVGAGATPEEAAAPLMIRAKGLVLALLNVAENEFGTARRSVPGSAPLSLPANIRAIREAAGRADLVLVVVHGGHERLALPSPRMRDTYRAFVEAGAAAVINCHTHCPGGIELWKGAPIVYSPGNFFFPWDSLSDSHLNAMWWVGYVPKLHVDRRGVHAMEVMPLRFDNSRIHPLTAAERRAFFGYLARLNRMTADDKAVPRYFEAWSARHGPLYLGWIRDRLARWPLPPRSRRALRELMPVRNIFTCEAHHDMVAQYLRLVEEGRAGKALEDWPAIRTWQSPPWAERHWKAMRAPR